MSQYFLYRWPGGPPDTIAPIDPSITWAPANPRLVNDLFGDDPHRQRAQLQMLRDGYIGLFCIADQQWCAYAWMRRPGRRGPPHVPTNVQRPAAYWITYCRTREGYQRRGLFHSALRRLVGLALAEDDEAEVYVDAESANNVSRRAILRSGFIHVGLIDTISAGLPRLGHVVFGDLRQRIPSTGDDEHAGRRPTRPGGVGTTEKTGAERTSWSARLVSPFRAGRFGRGVLVLSGGTALSQALLVLASPILTRVYAPADFGVYGAALSLITFLTVASSLRYERAIPLPDDESVAASLVAACLILVVATTVLGGGILIAIGPQIAAFLRAPSLVPILWVVVVAQIGAGAYQVMNAWAVRARSYSEIARTRVSQSIVTLAVQLGLGGFGLVSGGLVVGDAVGRSVGTGRLAVRLWRSNSRAVRSVTLAGIKDALVRFRRFGLLVAPASLLNSVSLQIPSIMLLALFGPTVGGWYLLVQRMGAIPASLVSVSVGQVFLGEAARVAREEPFRLPGLFRKSWRSLVAIGVGPMVALAVLGPILTPIVFGETWRDAGPYLTILAPMLFLQFAIEPVTAILVVLERQGVVIIGELIRAGMMVSIWLVAADRHLTPLATVGLISLAGSASYLMYFVVSRRAAQRSGSYRRRQRPGSDWGG